MKSNKFQLGETLKLFYETQIVDFVWQYQQNKFVDKAADVRRHPPNRKKFTLNGLFFTFANEWF